MSRPAALFVFVAMLATAAACEKVALLAPTGSTVTISVSSTALGANGTAEVIATVIEAGGTPVHNGTEVRFQASVGRVEPAVVRTESGVARTAFQANGASGTAKILAFSGGAKSTEVEVRVGSAAAETISVSSTPTSVSQTGGSVQVVAIVRDVGGSPLSGAQVVFSTDQGTLSAGNAITNDQGEARTTLTTSREANVKASVAGKEATTRVTVVTLPTVGISVSPTNPTVGAQVTVTVTPGSTTTGNPIRDVIVDFGDGGSTNLGAITSATGVQHVYHRAGQYTISATVVDIANQRTSNSTVVNVQPANVGILVTVSPNPADAGTAVTVTATPSNPNSVPLTGIRIDFGDGGFADLPPAGGSATHVYNPASTTATTYTIRATAADQVGNQYSNTAQLVVRPRAALTVTLDATVNENTNAFSCSGTYPKTCTTSLSAFVPPPGTLPGVRVVFTAALSGAFTTAASYIWDFNGDGIADRTTSSASTDFVFTAPGTYTIRVRVTTTDGNFAEQHLTLQIGF